jgi:hypothetical protein
MNFVLYHFYLRVYHRLNTFQNSEPNSFQEINFQLAFFVF